MTPEKAAARVRILYEIAMSIGNAADLQSMLREALAAIVRKLDAVLAAVVRFDGEVLRATPLRGVTELHEARLRALGHQWPAIDPIIDETFLATGRHLYLLRLPNVGGLLIERQEPLDTETVRALAPVCRKLATSIQACEARERMVAQERQLQETVLALQEAQKAKDMFLANMSHELRTPLNGMLGFLEQLRATPLDATQQEYLQIVLGSSRSLLHIINDLLDFTRIQSGHLSLESISMSPQAVIEPAVRLFAAKAQAAQTRLSVEISPAVPEWILGDPLRLGQVVSNLVSNAVKFTAKGTVQVWLDAAPVVEDPDDRWTLTLEVEDSGIGMSAQQLETIFKAFTQADASTTRRFGGTGLGLAICHSLMELMGGSLSVRSTPGVGSVFVARWTTQRTDPPASTIEVPLSVGEEAALASESAASTVSVALGERAHRKPPSPASNALPSFPHARVLVAEDNRVNQKLMQTLLQRMQIQYVLVADGEEAVEQALSRPFDLVLMDIHMPIMDGEAALKKLQQYALKHPAWTMPPVVALTANALRDDTNRYRASGMSDVLAKPLDLPQFTALLCQYLSATTSRSATPAAEHDALKQGPD